MTSRRSTSPKAYTSDERKRLINRKAGLLRNPSEDSLKLFSKLVDYSSMLYNKDDVDNFMSDFSCAVNGYCTGALGGIYKIGMPNLFSKAQEPRGEYYIGPDFFKGRGSWSSSFYDFSDNQMYHFWFYVALSYADGAVIARLGNWAHGDKASSPFVTSLSVYGESKQDYLLSLKGIKLGSNISNKLIVLSKLGEWIYKELSK